MTQQTQYCDNCGAALAPDSRFCENCGREVAQAQRRASRGLYIGLGIAGGVGLLCCGVVVIFLIFRGVQGTLTLPLAATAPVSPAQATRVLPTAAPRPSDTAAPPPPVEEARTRYDFEGVSFAYDASLAAAVDPRAEPAETEFNISPQHRRLVFLKYPQSQSVHEAYIAIYPAEEYQNVVPDGGGEVANLQQMLLQRPLVGLPDPLPFFVRWNAGQMLAAKIDYLDFQNGSGVRYLTQYSQDVYPVNNNSLFYTFQGITGDKKWLISAVMPVYNSSLPDPETLTADPGFYDNFAAYRESAIILLDDLPPSSYVPDLSLLDALFQSLKVQ